MWKDILKNYSYVGRGTYSGYAAQLQQAIVNRIREGQGKAGENVEYALDDKGVTVFFRGPSGNDQFVLSAFAANAERFIDQLGNDGAKYKNDANAFVEDLQMNSNLASLFDKFRDTGRIS